MPKSSARRKGRGPSSQKRTGGASNGNQGTANLQQTSQGQATRTVQRNRAFSSPPVAGPQSLLWPFMVALGCWGLAISFVFFSVDPNHTLYGALAALMALLWSFSFAIRVRKLLQQRSRSQNM
ncbi:MAG: hypothetical protein H0W02_11820 [Ktedonobacteraceae bacterium]|nr:hypothetical protein [Ktedonobacteraceae bacterium]